MTVYHLTEYHMGYVVAEFQTDDFKKARRFYQSRTLGESAVRVHVNGRKLPYDESNRLFLYSWHWLENTRKVEDEA